MIDIPGTDTASAALPMVSYNDKISKGQSKAYITIQVEFEIQVKAFAAIFTSGHVMPGTTLASVSILCRCCGL